MATRPLFHIVISHVSIVPGIVVSVPAGVGCACKLMDGHKTLCVLLERKIVFTINRGACTHIVVGCLLTHAMFCVNALEGCGICELTGCVVFVPVSTVSQITIATSEEL